MPRKFCFSITIFVLTALAQTVAAQRTHVVGHILGWTIPPGGPLVYQLWTNFQKYSVGDVLVFNFVTTLHTVVKVTKEAYDKCDASNPIAVEAISPARFILDTPGYHYYICSVGPHCPLGQKVSVNVGGTCSSAPPRPAAPRPLSLTSTRRDVVSHIVGDNQGWLVPHGGALTYSAWAYPKTFIVGDSLVFNFKTGQQDVARVTKEAYERCNPQNSIKLETTGPTNFRLDTAGQYYFIGTKGRACSLGQKLAINVTRLRNGPITHIVGDNSGWAPTPGGEQAFSTWADDKSFVVGDTLGPSNVVVCDNVVFNFSNKTHDVAILTKDAYEKCDTNNTIAVLTTSPASVTLTSERDYYFTSTFPYLCIFGQKLAINVKAAATTTTTASSSSSEGSSTTSNKKTLTPLPC